MATGAAASPDLKSEKKAPVRHWGRSQVFRSQCDTQEDQGEGIATTNLSWFLLRGQPCAFARLCPL